jgi:predicted DNA binding CopG/RHH family protein
MAKNKRTNQEKIDRKIEKWVDETDQSEAIAQGTLIQGRRGRPRVGTKITVTMPLDLIEQLKRSAEKRAIGYQTMIRMIVAENIKKYA